MLEVVFMIYIQLSIPACYNVHQMKTALEPTITAVAIIRWRAGC